MLDPRNQPQNEVRPAQRTGATRRNVNRPISVNRDVLRPRPIPRNSSNVNRPFLINRDTLRPRPIPRDSSYLQRRNVTRTNALRDQHLRQGAKMPQLRVNLKRLKKNDIEQILNQLKSKFENKSNGET